MHSNRSDKLSTYSEKAKQQDIVLNLEDIKRVGAKLGKSNTFRNQNALHDVFLSSKEVKEVAFRELFSWIDTLDKKRINTKNILEITSIHKKSFN